MRFSSVTGFFGAFFVKIVWDPTGSCLSGAAGDSSATERRAECLDFALVCFCLRSVKFQVTACPVVDGALEMKSLGLVLFVSGPMLGAFSLFVPPP